MWAHFCGWKKYSGLKKNRVFLLGDSIDLLVFPSLSSPSILCSIPVVAFSWWIPKSSIFDVEWHVFRKVEKSSLPWPLRHFFPIVPFSSSFKIYVTILYFFVTFSHGEKKTIFSIIIFLFYRLIETLPFEKLSFRGCFFNIFLRIVILLIYYN